jgi:hypothetical protein
MDFCVSSADTKTDRIVDDENTHQSSISNVLLMTVADCNLSLMALPSASLLQNCCWLLFISLL